LNSIKQALAALIVLLLNICLVGQVFDEKFEHWPLHTKINGRIVILNEVGDTTASDKFVIDASGKEGAVVGVISVTELSEAEKEGYKSRFAKVKDIKFVSLQESDFDQKLGVTLKDATVALLDPPNPVTFNRSLPLDERVAVPLKRGFSQLLQRSGTLVAEGQWAKLISKRYLKNGDLPEAYEGLDLFPDSIVDTNFETQQDVRRLKSALVAFPKSVGIGISNDTTLVCSGRKCFVLNQGKAKFLLSANTRQPQREQTIQPARNRREMTASLVDLTQWRRDAIDRELEPFPPATPKPPVVENGTLVIVGGGGMPRNLMSQIVDMAGGPEKAKMVYVPCAEQDDVGETQRTVEAWKRMGVKHATFIHTKDRNKANSDEEFLAPLKDATGIWFGGGRQWNFADSYYGTKAHQLMKDVLKRGGVIGGSSAGASIQARYLARATPIGNFQIMAPGYERGGLGFISGVAIDQHFSQRGRQKDMTTLMAKHPQLLGIGLDEATAIIVKKSNAKVVGRGKAHFYDRNLPVYPDRPDYVALPAGSEYELSERKVIADTSKLKSGDSKDEESKSKAEPETPPKNS
jgi:cyanophycinase